MWGIYHFSGYNWFSLNKISQDTSNPKELNSKDKIKEQLKDIKDFGNSKEPNLALMTKKQSIDHAKTLGLGLNMKLKK